MKSLAPISKKLFFFSLPNSKSSEFVQTYQKQITENDICLIDLSGDFRLKDESLHQEFYPDSFYLKELREIFVYGLSEQNKTEITNAKFIANPGCFATACTLATLPITEKVDSNIVFDTKTGSSGSGRLLKETTHFSTRHANLKAYKALSHQHMPEIAQTLAISHQEMSFIAQSLPVVRGIFATVHLSLKEEISSEELKDLYQNYYKDNYFIRIREESPELQNVIGTNFCDISATASGKQVIIIAAIDNLVKGMAGQAIQNMNIICNLNETIGLTQPSLRPV